MSQATYSHKLVQLRCTIESDSQKPIKLKLPSTNDWKKNLESIYQRVPQKFKFIKKMDKSEWQITINNKIIDESDPAKFAEIISFISPPVVLQIVKVDINDAIDEILGDMKPNEIESLQTAMDDVDGKGDDIDDDKDDGKGDDDDEDEKGGGDEYEDAKGGDDDDDDGKGGDDGDDDNKSGDTTSKKRVSVKAKDTKAVKKKKKQVIQEVKIPIEELLKQLEIEGINMEEQLTILGSSVGLLGDAKKQGSFGAIKGILEGAQKDDPDTNAQFQDLLRNMLKNESQKYAKCALQFVILLGYTLTNTKDGIIVSGDANKDIIKEINKNFHHFSNSMQKPVENIYQQLNLSIPKTENVMYHKSGILDNQFITFLVIQIVLENQQTSLVNKNILDPKNFERFVNFLVPNSSKYLCKEMYFEKLKKYQIQAIGLYGTRMEILDMLVKYNAISKPLYNVLINDKENRFLQPGIHAILPIALQKGTNFKQWCKDDAVIYIFYWSLPNSFEMKKMKAVKYMRKDPSCLLTRVLYEICSTVCIQVSVDELLDFGIIYQLDQDGKVKFDKRKKSRKKLKMARKGRGRQKIDFELEETKENMVCCKPAKTEEYALETKRMKRDDRWKKFKAGQKLGAKDSGEKWYMAEIVKVKAAAEDIDEFTDGYDKLKRWQENGLERLNKCEAIFIHYVGWSKKWDEWVFLEEYTACDCMGDDCSSFLHRLKPKEKQNKELKWEKSKKGWMSSAIGAVASMFTGGDKDKGKKGNKGKDDKDKGKDDKDKGKDDKDKGKGDKDKGKKGVTVKGLDEEDGNGEEEEENKEEEEDEDGIEWDYATDTFLLNAHRLSYYGQFYPLEARNINKTINFECSQQEEVKTFFEKMNKQFIIKWKKVFVSSGNGMDYVAWALLGDEYDTYKTEDAKLDKEEEKDRKKKNFKKRIDEELRRLHREINHEFHKLYTSKKYCKDPHNNIRSIIVDANDNGILNKDLIDKGALYYATIVPEKTDLPKAQWTWFKDTCLEKMAGQTDKLLKTFSRINNKTDKVINDFVANWLKLYVNQLGYYTNNVYGGGKFQSSILHRGTIKNEIESQIWREYNKKRYELKMGLEKLIEDIQKTKDPEKMKTITLTHFDFTEKRWNNASETYEVTYTIPTVVPPSYEMTFGTTVLENVNEDIRVMPCRNMKYEILQTDTLLLHQIMHNGDAVLFIRHDNPESKVSETKIISSNSRVLNIYSTPLKVLKIQAVQMVAYCESQKLFALLFEDFIGFCIWQLGGRISMTNKRCELRDIAWWDKKFKFKVMMLEEIDKNIYLWLIDENNVVRAFDYDASSFDYAKEFKLDQSYDSYQLLPASGSFLITFKPQYQEDIDAKNEESKEEEKDDEKEEKAKDPDESKPAELKNARKFILKDCASLRLYEEDAVIKTDTELIVKFLFKDTNAVEWTFVVKAKIEDKEEILESMCVEKYPTGDEKKDDDVILVRDSDRDYADLLKKVRKKFPEVKNVQIPKKEEVKKTPTGRIELHTFLLLEKKKLDYVVHLTSSTGYETGTEKKLPEPIDAEDEEAEKKREEQEAMIKAEFSKIDNVLLPTTFTTVDDYIKCNQLRIQVTNQKDDFILCTITKDGKLLYHSLIVQVSETKLRINKAEKKLTARRITKLDYMEYMIEKFGSRAAITFPEDQVLALHTTYIMKDKPDKDEKDAYSLCKAIARKICRSLEHKEKKNFAFLDWECNVLEENDEKLQAKDVLGAIRNKKPLINADKWIQDVIIQVPIQICRGVDNKFMLMYNGEDNQAEYAKATDSYALCKAIRFGAYDGLIKSWEGDIKVVTSMGKQSTGKSYMLNHLFGTKFDISGGRCTDGGWFSVKIIDNILYVICDFEGLGSFERSPQEDMLLATFNSAVSNCTIFKCDNRFDRTVEDMFNKFQSGVKIMSGSQNCFTGELLLIIKDVVDTGAEAAVADFKRHIERLAQEAELIRNDKGKKESSFFVSQMYKSGLELIPYPPLANEAFFRELNDTLEIVIDDIEPIHHGGKIFLDFYKLVMAKLHIGDFSAMSGEQAKIRSQEIRDTLTNAVETGSCLSGSKNQYGVTFQVEDDENLLLLDGNQLITIKMTQVLDKCTDFKAKCKKYDSKNADNIEKIILDTVESISDAGLILGKTESLQFLYEQFNLVIPRTHVNHKKRIPLYQIFLDLLYWRRRLRVLRFIQANTRKFEDEETREIETLVQAADSRLNSIRDKMKLCKRKCKNCFYRCLLCKNHEDDSAWADDHDCYETNHQCQQACAYCKKSGSKNKTCGDMCGHSGKHNCRDGTHTCGKKCSLSKYGGCQTNCNLESGHKSSKKCKCAAESHYCVETCAVAICHHPCKYPYNQKHKSHICLQQSCPYKCQVQTWNDGLQEVTDCGRPCECNEHDHQIQLDKGDCKDEGHTCEQEHPCPEFCTELGNCRVEVQRKIVEKETLVTGAGSKIVYDSFAEVNAEKRRCCVKIPIGMFQHAEASDDSHKCYEGKLEDNLHTCEEKCDSCGYFCQMAFNHYKDKGVFHDCVHGNMRNTVFYATEEIVDTGDNRKYKVGDKGVAEMCNIFCERMGRGHIHLELCAYEGKSDECVEEEGRRHQSKEYMPNPEIQKDEVKHGKFWRRKKWKDPCVEKYRKIFDKCNYVCQHEVHDERAKKGEKDDVKYCVENLWHKPVETPSGHTFHCKHPFNSAHIIFVCDISGSMGTNDGGTSVAHYSYIDDSGSLNNRLGALYGSIHNFLKVRLNKGCKDTLSAIVTPGLPHDEGRHMAYSGQAKVATRVMADEQFVEEWLIKYKPGGDEHYGHCMADARDIIDPDEDTVCIFLTDGIPVFGDAGCTPICEELASTMGKKFIFFCILLGPISESGNSYMEAICKAGNGTLLGSLNGNELGSTFTQIAKQMNSGAFGKL